MGVDPKRVMAELLGKVTGLLRNGWFHAYFLKEHRFYGGHGVGGQIPVGAGLAFADKYFETNAVTLTYFVMVQLKALCEAFNMAMLWKLPVVLSLKITVTRWELL
jgi:pyruvate dehydrogenase E1 component alpha subunit